MEIQKSEPDPFEKDIICKLHLFDHIPQGKWGNKLAGHDVKNAVGEVAEKRGYKVRAHATDYSYAERGEWLYDLTCIEYEGGHIKGIPLVMESEWDRNGVDDDFPKLVVARADHRVMVLQVESDEDKEEIIQQLLQHVQKCRHSTEGDRYLFACWNRVGRSFDCPVYIVVG
ncbi:MAG: hypothetical protein ABSA64_09675 [Sedimentisphaerales bacterium]|jgi:hypothetical protein